MPPDHKKICKRRSGKEQKLQKKYVSMQERKVNNIIETEKISQIKLINTQPVMILSFKIHYYHPSSLSAC